MEYVLGEGGGALLTGLSRTEQVLLGLAKGCGEALGYPAEVVGCSGSDGRRRRRRGRGTEMITWVRARCARAVGELRRGSCRDPVLFLFFYGLELRSQSMSDRRCALDSRLRSSARGFLVTGIQLTMSLLLLLLLMQMVRRLPVLLLWLWLRLLLLGTGLRLRCPML